MSRGAIPTTSTHVATAARTIFIDDKDQRHVPSRCSAPPSGAIAGRCLSYCLMDNHYHLLLETPEANLWIGMRHLQGSYAQTFNKRHKTVGTCSRAGMETNV